MQISANSLGALREGKKWSRRELAERTKRVDEDHVGISERQIARLEAANAGSTNIRERTFRVLASALEARPGVLSGTEPLPIESGSQPESARVSITTFMTSETRLSYGLIKRRYGINPTTIINMAPLFFTLLAEGSLLWRREKLAQFREAANQVREVKGRSNYLSFVNAIYRAENAANEEQRSIDATDLFGQLASEDAFDLGYDPNESNPFADYLHMLADKIGDEEIVEVQPFIEDSSLLKGFPSYSVCRADLKKIAGNSAVAEFSLQWGHVRLSDIPNELLSNDKDEDRARWIEEQTPREVKELFQRLVEV